MKKPAHRLAFLAISELTQKLRKAVYEHTIGGVGRCRVEIP